MSKWYGQSLPYNQEIVILEDGLIKKKPIGEVVQSGNKNIKVLAFDENGKTTFSQVTDLIKHKNRSKILEVKTQSGRKIKVTDYHSLFTLKGNKIESVKTSELIPGQSYVAVPKMIPVAENIVKEINFLEYLRKNDLGLVIRDVKNQLRLATEKLGHRETAKMLGFKEKYLYDVISKNVGIKVSKFLELMEKAAISIDPEQINISSKGKSLPAKIKITKDFCEFLGLWIAEGSFNGDEAVRISIHQNEVKKVLPLIESLFGKATLYQKKDGKGVDIYITHKVLVTFMKNLLGMADGARRKKVPEIIFSTGRENIAAFLRGYFSGDGSLAQNHRNVITIEGSTESEKLANDLTYLLTYFGIVAKIYPRARDGHEAYRVCFAGAQPIEKFKEIGFFDHDKMEKINNYLNGVKWDRDAQIPITSSIKSYLSNVNDAKPWTSSSTIGIGKLEQFASQTEGLGHEDILRIKKLVNMDIYWDRVEEINEVENEEYVYDISVNPAQNFVGGFGGIFAHNSEENLRKIFEDAEKNAPSIIFIDEVDAIAPKREEVTGEVERRVVAQLLSLMDGMRKRGRVVVIAATNRENAIDPALRRPGRFDREVEIGVPDRKGRREVLQIHTRNMPLDKTVSIDELAAKTHGFVGADVEALAKEAAISVLRRVLPEIRWREEGEIPSEIMEKLIVTSVDFDNALKIVEPSAMREVLVEIPNVKWSDIGGMEELKERLQEVIEWPLQNPDAFKKMGIKPPRGILLYGPPGCGKTMIVKAVANEAGLNFISIKGPELLSKWVGESEKAVREIFRRARQVSPAIVFFDEIDALAPRRGLEMGSRVTEQVVSQLLTEMSGLEDLHDVIVIAATNRPDILDPALLRPGRFDRHILVTAPDADAREKIFKVHTSGMPLNKDVSIEKIAKETEGYSGADIEALCREAAISALREDIKAKEVRWRHFEAMLKVIKPSLSPELMRAYQAVFEMMKKPDKKDELQEQLSYVG
ncbi:MAG: AAA family ATPase [Candidatus Aenigmarchaeota archaeon]|nr:AAA family ATPase [Candidatus Aenigmarchaeota archaeon]